MGIAKNATVYKDLLANIGSTLMSARQTVALTINSELVKANWNIGKHIVDFEQHGEAKAKYGEALLSTLAKDLKLAYGKGFSKSNLYLCRQFYLKYPTFQTLSGKLSWSHYSELVTISTTLLIYYFIIGY
jgi:hypothetical protein